MVKVKICGITNVDDALAAVEAGADALGFNFYRPSPRFIEPGLAREIIRQLPATVTSIGVFANEADVNAVARIAGEAGIFTVQLHGDESPEYCRTLEGLSLIKVLRVKDGFQPEQAATYQTDAIMLDAFDRNLLGGTGRLVDWALAARTRTLVNKMFLAGGLSAANVAAAISAVRPYGVDACSRIESAPGRKDLKAMRDFVAAVRTVLPI
ncbi:MAG: phosphoribosylanthranilate isomerase [Blastocatellia bacterium]|jgi:phosphoribosylanthranilate isomerase|nr:phosphoribosylanthranilate isomerase [Blastocatellia bacterium]